MGTTSGTGHLPPLPSLPVVSGTDTTRVLVSRTNLLGGGLQLFSEGVYVDNGVPPVPEKLASKIRCGDFVEMGALLPKFWSHAKGEKGEPSHETS